MRSVAVGLTVFALWLGVGTAALATGQQGTRTDVPREQWRPIDEIIERLSGMGYEVRGIEGDEGVYEVEAVDPNGVWVKAYVDPVSGELLSEQPDDDD
jgi:hypothetical protein